MSFLLHCVPPDRAIIEISGEDRQAFLQGLISNDTAKISAERAIYAAFLTPQGRFLHDMFIVEIGGSYLVDCEAARKEDLLRRLSLYRLRAKVALHDVALTWRVCLIHGPGTFKSLPLPADRGAAGPLGGGVAFSDPRMVALGARAIIPSGEVAATLTALGSQHDETGLAYDRLRASLGVPSTPLDLIPEKSLLLESGLDELNAIDWEKGCYLGQELTARSKYRGLVRKRLFPVEIIGPTPPPGSPLLLDGKEIGEMRSGIRNGGLGIALIRLEAFANSDRPILKFGETEICPVRPNWMKLPELQTIQ